MRVRFANERDANDGSDAGGNRVRRGRHHCLDGPAQRQIGNPDNHADQRKQDVNFHRRATAIPHSDLAVIKPLSGLTAHYRGINNRLLE